jgi:hypothetical protein
VRKEKLLLKGCCLLELTEKPAEARFSKGSSGFVVANLLIDELTNFYPLGKMAVMEIAIHQISADNLVERRPLPF